MRFLLPKRKKEINEKEQERRNKKFYDLGAKISLKLGLPQKVKKANDFYAKHPKSVSFAIMGVCIAMFIQNIIVSHSLSQQVNEAEKNNEWVSATPLISAMDKQMEGMRKTNDLALIKQKISTAVDSLEKSDSLSPEDSAILIKSKEILKKIGDN